MLKIEVNRQILMGYLGVMPKVVNGDLPILESVLLKRSSESSFELISTNLSQAVTAKVNAKVAGEGAIAIPSKIFSELVSSLNSEIVTLEEMKNSRLKIKTENHQSTIYLLKIEDFPEIPEVDLTKKIEVETSLLKSCFTKTVLAASKDDTRPILGGVMIHSLDEKDSLLFVATDGYRLSECSLNLEADLSELPKTVIPTQTIQDLSRILQSVESERVKIFIEDGQIAFKINEIILVSRVVDGDYPDYARLIPADYEIEAELDRDEFMQTIKIASIFARESAGAISLEFDKEAQSLNIDSVANQKGENHSSIAANVNNDGLININSRYLLDALGSIDSEIVKVHFSKGLTPFVIKPLDRKDIDHLHLIMPINT